MAKILVHGHRGCRAVRPENTLPAFEHALKVGVDVLEMDLCVTHDDVLVASHDPFVNDAICRGPAKGVAIRLLTYQELQQWDCGAVRNPQYPHQVPAPGARIPALDDILRLGAPTRVWFNIETKMRERPDLAPEPEKFAALVLEAVRRHNVASRTILQSFDYRSLRAMKKLDPKIRLAALDDIGKGDFVELARSAEADIISPRFDFVTPEKVRAAHAAGLEVVAWTANRPAEWRRLIDAGVDAIITDDPEALINYLSVHGLR
jgi:glycerophosphoryl diester phosphodiesterase